MKNLIKKILRFIDLFSGFVMTPPLKGKIVEYRRLQKDEIIQEDDEVDGCGDGWRDDPVWEKTTCVGERAPDPRYPSHRQHRRKLDKVKRE